MAGKPSNGKAGDSGVRPAQHNIQAEEGVVGCLMLGPGEVLPLVTPIVSGDMFFDRELGKVFDVCCYLSQAGKPINNHKWLWGELPKHGTTIAINELIRLATQQPHYAHARYYAEQVRDLARLRKFASIASQLESMAYSTGIEPAEVERWLDGQVLAARHGDQAGDEILGDVMQRVVNDFESRLQHGNLPVLLSGFPTADQCGFVFAPGELTVLAARTGMGKTTLATQVGLHHANKGRCVLMASLEMKSTEVAGRLLAAASGNNFQALRIGRIDDVCVSDLRKAANGFADVPFRLWSPGRVTVGKIHAMSTMRKATNDVQLLIVDLLQCVKWDDHRDEEHHAYSKITKGLRDIAQQLQIPVMLVAQLSRGAEGERPSLKHLKGSGAIEEDADVVAMLHSEKRKSETVELIIEKNRFGSPGTVPLKFAPAESRFLDMNGSEWNG